MTDSQAYKLHSTLFVSDTVSQDAYPRNLYLYLISILKRTPLALLPCTTHPARRTRHNHGSSPQRSPLRQERYEGRNVKYQICDWGVLAQLPIHSSLELQLGRIRNKLESVRSHASHLWRDDLWAHWSKLVEPFTEAPLRHAASTLLEPLPFTCAYIVASSVARNIAQCVLLAHVLAISTNDNTQLAFVVCLSFLGALGDRHCFTIVCNGSGRLDEQ